MRIILAAAVAAATLPAVPAMAQSYNHNERAARADCARDLRNADSRREYRREAMDCRRDIAQARHDDRRAWQRDWRTYRNYNYNRLPRGETRYWADDYYRDGRYYQERRLTRNDRIYRGRDGRYYCRRSDGTTGLIVGGVAGGLFGNAIAGGGNATLGTLLGAAVGATLGASVDRNNIRCR
ncbi:MAG: glycine zipper 2TM domain-containing protein [Sphingomonas sp.]|uniref:glycine zipper 2TM domain-containing protein n=1 Tax=Sphingomonas sp. TaxID=28214 RepID=UPI0025CC0B3A|nr:glycine zipper 2TM domain-containing protein [Sphingomonas sp.]MBX3563765.1 glycine zipper 2TM domain-containing protein [Sphingomonas sp.]